MNLELCAQYFNPGTDPASVRWNQVRSEHYRVIYPRGMDSTALHTVNAMEYFREPVSSSMRVLPSKWPVILHNRTVISNAYTPYAPKRIEMLTTPPQDNDISYGQNWIDQLVIHESRHTIQYASVNRGMTRALTYLLGQQALPGVLGVFVPWWFFEGDAVVTETANSNTGRGRTPAFDMKLRAQFLQKGQYSYDKAVNGSYKDFIPDHYELGYQLVGHTRDEFGRDVWQKVMRRTGNFPLMLVPFSNTLYRQTGYGKSRLYDHVASNLLNDWSLSDWNIRPTPFSRVSVTPDRFYTDRNQPVVLENGRIIALRTSIDDIPRIVSIDTLGQECLLLSPGPMIDGNLSGAADRFCWAEVAYDPRWNYRTYSVIKLLDLKTGEVKQISHKSRYFSPGLSIDGNYIVAVHVNELNQNFLAILDANNGRVMHEYPTPGNYFPDHPSWSPDGGIVAVVLTRDEGKSLAIMDVTTGEYNILLPFSYTDISKPSFSDTFIYFTGAYTGTDNIFAFDPDRAKLYQVTASRFGATDATVSPDGGKLYYADYCSDGYSIVTAEIAPSTWKEADPAAEYHWQLAGTLASQEKFTYTAANIPDSAYTIRPYRKGAHLFNFHSWAPLSVNLDNMETAPGVMLMSQNLLGSSTAILGFSYDINMETGKYYLKYSYDGLYPTFDLQTDYGLRRAVHHDSTGQYTYRYNELNLAAGLRVPLNWSVRSWYVGLQPYAGYSLKFLKMVPGTDLQFRHDRVNSLDYQLFLYAQSRMSGRDLQPAWGQQLTLNFRHSPFDADTANSIFALEGLIYLPGIARHHGFRLYAGYQDRYTDYYVYADLISFPRGFNGIYADQAFSGSVTYKLPLAYPDWHAGPLFYLKRIKAAAFYDMMLDFDAAPDEYYQSCGIDLTMDFHLFRWFVPFEAGLRSIYLPKENRFEFEFLYSVNIGSLY